jgi:hypothetical protein
MARRGHPEHEKRESSRYVGSVNVDDLTPDSAEPPNVLQSISSRFSLESAYTGTRTGCAFAVRRRVLGIGEGIPLHVRFPALSLGKAQPLIAIPLNLRADFQEPKKSLLRAGIGTHSVTDRGEP